MKHAIAFLIKYAAIGTVLFSFLAILNTASLGEIFFISIILTIAAYLIGDLYILPKYGNLMATAADFGLSFFLIWLLSSMLLENTTSMFWTSLFASLTITGIEALFHLYLKNHLFSDSAKSFIPGVYQEDKMLTEFSEEINHKTQEQNQKEKAKNYDVPEEEQLTLKKGNQPQK